MAVSAFAGMFEAVSRTPGPGCSVPTSPRWWELVSRNSSANTLLFTCVSRGTNGAYIQSICHSQTLFLTVVYVVCLGKY